MNSIYKHIALQIHSQKFCFLLFVGVILSSCTLLFEPEETTYSKIETYDQLIDACNGVYGLLLEATNNAGFYNLNATADDLQLGNSENYFRAYYGGSKGCSKRVQKPYTDGVYIDLYKTISSINSILVQYNEKDKQPQEINELLGEMYFFRAYCYFRLTRSFGKIPLIIDTDVSYTTELAPFVDIYENIEYDLLKASELLPENISRVDYQTPHQGTAKALLAEVYLSWAGYPVKDQSKYELAASTATEVISHASEYHFELLPDFANLWNYKGRYNQELILSFYCSVDPSQTYIFGNLYYLSLYYYPNERTNPDFSTSFFESPRIYYSVPRFIPEVNFFNNFPENYRKDETFFNRIYVPQMEDSPAGLDTGYIYINKIDACTRVAYKKFYRDTTVIYQYNFGRGSSIKRYTGNPRTCILRYGQTLLTYAEAAARAGKLDAKAYECVNMIRRRANKVDLFSTSEFDLLPGLSADAFADSVFQERAWELAGEPEGRWFDLLRLEKIDEVMSSVDPMEVNYLYDSHTLKNFFLPLPQSDIILNNRLGDSED